MSRFRLALLAVLSITTVSIPWLMDPVADDQPPTETDRIRHHLDRAARFLVTHEPASLTEEQQERRARIVELVTQYRDHGIFPRNHSSAEMKLFFVDQHAVPCALAWVIAETRHPEIVEAVSSRMNGGWVYQIAADAELRGSLSDWLRENGLTVADAATIQVPGYTCVDSCTGGRRRDERSVRPRYAVASGLSVGTSAVTTAITLSNFQTSGSLPAWMGLASGGFSVGLGLANLDAEGPRRTVAAVDVVGGIIALGTSVTRLVIGARQPGEFDVSGHALAPSVDFEDSGRKRIGLRFSF